MDISLQFAGLPMGAPTKSRTRLILPRGEATSVFTRRRNPKPSSLKPFPRSCYPATVKIVVSRLPQNPSAESALSRFFKDMIIPVLSGIFVKAIGF